MNTTTSAARPRPGLAAGAFVLDLVLVVAFTAIGRAQHGEAAFSADLLHTAWPFAVGLVVGWIVTLAWRAPFAIVRTGVPLWLLTVAIGMVLRAVSGQGVAIAFVVVATIVVGAFLLGWRGIVALIRRQRGSQPTRSAAR